MGPPNFVAKLRQKKGHVPDWRISRREFSEVHCGRGGSKGVFHNRLWTSTWSTFRIFLIFFCSGEGNGESEAPGRGGSVFN